MNVTESVSPFLTASQQHYLATARPLYYTPASQVFPGIPDYLLALIAPVVAYWTASGIFHALDVSEAKWLDKYRLHDSAEVKARNLASRGQVFRAVVLQHVVQTVVGYWWLEIKPVGEQVNHLAALAGNAHAAFSLLRGLLGDGVGTQLWSTYCHYLLYATYWWAIPISKMLLGMCAFHLTLR